MTKALTSGKAKATIKRENLVTKAHKYSNSQGANKGKKRQQNTRKKGG